MYQFLLLQTQHFYIIIGEPHSVENECYGVLGGGVPQSTELKDNAAYSSVSAPRNQSIAMEDNVAYVTVKADHVYDVPVNT